MSAEARRPGAEFEIGMFTDQAYNAILLAQDEARMLGRTHVGPEHVLLAVARSGNGARLLDATGIRASDVHRAIVEAGGLDATALVLGEVPLSREAAAALERSVSAAAARGVISPSTEHLLLGLASDGQVTSILHRLGVPDVEPLVDRAYPERRPALTDEQMALYAARTRSRPPPMPGPVPPAFERFTSAARNAIEGAEQIAASFANEYVAPWHLLLGVLDVAGSPPAVALARHGLSVATVRERARDLRRLAAGPPTGILEPTTRRIIAEGALGQAHLHGQTSIGTGHLGLALLENPGEVVTQLVGPSTVIALALADIARAVTSGWEE